MDKLAWISAIGNSIVPLLYIALAVVGVYLIYRLYKWGKGVYDNFLNISGSATEANFVNMFTPHTADGSVAPKDIAPKGVDPVDWLFMNHEDPT